MAAVGALGSPGTKIAGSLSQRALHPFAQKLPSPKKSENEAINKDNKNNHDMTAAVLSAMLRDDSGKLVQHLYMETQRFESDAVQAPGLETAPTFEKAKTAGGVDETWLIEILASQSDMTSKEIVGTKKQDNKNPQHLFQLGSDLNPALSLPECCRIKEFYRRIILKLFADCGNRLQHWKRDGGLTQEGNICWKRGKYTVTITAEGATFWHRVTGHEYKMPNEEWARFTGYVLDGNWSDAAWLDKDPLPKVPIMTWFDRKGKKGPYAKTPMSQKSFNELCATEFAKFQSEKAQVGGTAQVADTIAKELKDLKSDKRKSSVAASVEKQKETAKKRKGDRVVELGH